MMEQRGRIYNICMSFISIGSWIWAFLVLFFYLKSHPFSLGSIGFSALALPGISEFAFGLGFVILSYLAGFGILRKAGCDGTSLGIAVSSLPAGLFAASLAGTILFLLFPIKASSIAIILLLCIPAISGLRSAEFRASLSRLKPLFHDPAFKAAMAAVLLLSLLDLPGLMAPATAYDDQVYHLSIPKLYLESGEIRHLPELPPANRPQSIHILYTILGCFSGDTAIRSINWCFGVATSLLLAIVIGCRGSPTTGALAAIAWQTHPEIALMARTAYTDLPIAYLTLATIFLISELRKKEPSSILPALSLVAAFASGVKTSGLELLFLAMLATPVVLRFRPDWDLRQKHWMPNLLLFIATTSLLGFPWYLRNWYVTGNPVYPHLGYLWNFTRFIPTAIAAFEKVFPVPMPFIYDHTVLLDRFGMGRDTLALLQLPWNVTIHGHVHDTAFSLIHFDGQIGFLPLALAPLLLGSIVERKSHPEHALLALVTFGAFILWAAGSHQIRFLLPCLALVAALCGLRLDSAFSDKKLACVLALAAILYGGSFSMTRNLRLEPFLSGKESASGYLRRELPFYEAYQWFNTHAEPRDKLLPLFEERVYYLSKPFQWMELVPFPFISAIIAAHNSSGITAYLHEMGISHLYLPSHGKKMLCELFNDKSYQAKLATFFSANAPPVYSDAYGTIWRIVK